ncbi:MAG TPA: VWA domain-containing protein, partial [Gemmatimonadales bacterium]|nr:VWA domain-containing protein [Gemmatimonadales bacterium]
MTLTFLHPAILLLLLAVPVVFGLLSRAAASRRANLDRFGDRALLGRSSSLPPVDLDQKRHRLRTGALAFLIIALARPQIGARPSSMPHAGRDILVLLDISRSMGSPDIKPSRLDAAKRAAIDLVAKLPGDRVGLVVFGGNAFLQLPLVQDHAAFKLFVDAASSRNLYDPSTDVATALKTALSVFEHEGSHGSRAIVLITDGETQALGVEEVTPTLQREHIPVIAIGVGTLEGGPVPADSSEAPEPWHRDHIGRVVNSKLMEDVLIRLSRETGGTYLRWRDGQGMGPLVERIRQVEAHTLDAGSAGLLQADRFQWPLGAGVLLLLAESLAGIVAPSRKARRVPSLAPAATTVLLLAAMLSMPGCSAAYRDAKRGERHYTGDRWHEALEAFDKAVAAGGGNVAAYDAGNALYRMSQYENAIKRYQLVPDDSSSLFRAARFNLGNAYVREAEEQDEFHRDQPLRRAVEA